MVMSGRKSRICKAKNLSANGVFVETDASTTKSNAWETLVFDFATPASTPLDITKTYDKLSIFFDFGVAGAGKTYYFDDVSFDRFATLTFDASTVAYAFAGFGGAENSSVAADPTGGANQVVKVVKASGAQTWAGTTMSMVTSDFSLPRLPFTATAQAKVPNAQPVSAEIEDEDGKLIYSFDFKTKGKSGIDEVNVDASTGEILYVAHETPSSEAREKAADAKKSAVKGR